MRMISHNCAFSPSRNDVFWLSCDVLFWDDALSCDALFSWHDDGLFQVRASPFHDGVPFSQDDDVLLHDVVNDAFSCEESF